MVYIPQGIERKLWCKAETTFDTVVAEAATNAIDFIDFKITPELKHTESRQHVGTASLQGFIESTRGGKWSGDFYLNKIGVGATTPPDIGPDLLKAAIGAEAIGGANVVYSLVDTAPTSLQFVHTAGLGVYEIINGCWVEQVDFDINGQGDAIVKIQGGFASYGWVNFGGLINAAAIAGATTVVLTAATAGTVGKNALIKFASGSSKDNSGAGYRVTAVASDGVTLTITPGLAGPDALSGGEPVYPITVSQTLAGTVYGALNCALTVGGNATGFRSAKIGLKTGVKPLEGEGASNRATGLVRGDRRIEGSLDVYWRDTEQGLIMGRAWVNTLQALSLRIGPNTATYKSTLALPKVLIEVNPINFPGADAAVASLKFMAKQSAAACDEMTLTYD